MLRYLKLRELEKVSKACGSGHWDCTDLEVRWDYHKKAIDIIKKLHLKDACRVLEMGTMGASLVKGSHTIDYAERWDFPDKQPTYLHDGREIPWPINDKQYDVFVALRVFQHLFPKQKECFKEAMRIANHVIIVVPQQYDNNVLPDSQGITKTDFTEWNNGDEPTLVEETKMGTLFYWNNTGEKLVPLTGFRKLLACLRI